MARLVTTKSAVYEKQPVHDHKPNVMRAEGKMTMEPLTYSSYMETMSSKKDIILPKYFKRE